MNIGPLQTLLIVFKNRELPEEVARELYTARKNGLISLVDSVFVEKDVQGKSEVFAVTDLNREEAQNFMALILDAKDTLERREADPASLYGDFLISSDDVEAITERVPSGSSAMIALIEHRWARRLQQAIEDTGGSLLAERFLEKSAISSWGAKLIEAIEAA